MSVETERKALRESLKNCVRSIDAVLPDLLRGKVPEKAVVEALGMTAQMATMTVKSTATEEEERDEE